MRQISSFVIFAAAALVATSAAAQEPVARIKGSGVERTIDCSETPRVEVTGERNVVRLVGDCRKVKLSGVGHVVRAEGIAQIEMSGASHSVDWQHVPGGGKPRVDDNGLGNIVVQVERVAASGAEAAPAASPAPVASPAPATTAAPAAAVTRASTPQAPARAQVETGAAPPPPARRPGTLVARDKSVEISGAGEHRTFRCDGGSLIVSGSNNDILAWGDCERIEINGYGNRVRVEGIRRLEVNGVNQDVAWVRGVGDEHPAVASHGMGNRVRQVELEELD